MKYRVQLIEGAYDFEATHWKFYASSVAKFCPVCGAVWATIRLDSAEEIHPEVAYCEEHASKATNRVYPNIFIIGMPLPGSILDFWACTPERPDRDPLDELPEALIQREFYLYLNLISIGVLRYESASSSSSSLPSSILDSLPDLPSASLDGWLQNPS